MNLELVCMPSTQSKKFFQLPLSITSLYNYLREHDVDADILDLNIVFQKEIKNQDKKGVNLELFTFKNHKEVINYLAHGKASLYFKKNVSRLSEKISFKEYNIIGFSVIDCFTLVTSLVAAKYIKKEKPDTKIVFGGMGLFNNEIHLLKDFDFIDYVIKRDSYLPLQKLVNYIAGNGEIKDVPNLCYREKGKVVSNPVSYESNVFCPDFSRLNVKDYVNQNDSEGRAISISYKISKGCIYNCAFCSSRAYSKFMYKPLDTVIEEIKGLYNSNKHITNHFIFQDDLFNFNYDYLYKFCELLIKNNIKIKWHALFNFNNLDYKLLKKLKEAGCNSIQYGLESASPRILEFIKKPMSVEKVKEIIKDTSELEINFVVNFIVGFPHEKNEDIDSIIDFLKKNSEYIRFINLFPFYLMKESHMFNNSLEYGITNIREFNYGILGKYYYNFAFDEIDGLSWEERQKRVRIIFDKIIRCTNEHGIKVCNIT